MRLRSILFNAGIVAMLTGPILLAADNAFGLVLMLVALLLIWVSDPAY